MRYIPNLLTILRMVLLPFFIWPFLNTEVYGKYSLYIGLVLFILLALTDTFDGYLARKYNWVSDFGKFWDPFADKLLVYSAFFLLVYLKVFSIWIVLLLLLREVLVTLHRTAALSKGKAIAAVFSGKLKTTFQMITIILALGDYVLKNPLLQLPNYLLYFTLLITIYSGIDYFLKNGKLVTFREFMFEIYKLLLTVLYVGKIKGPKGTWGSLVAVLSFYFWLYKYDTLNLLWIFPLLALLMFIANYSKRLFGNDDASEIVADEFIAQSFILVFTARNIYAYLIAFIFFRIFDIMKPWPVSYFDHIKNGLGIMLDDIVAALYALFLIQLFSYLNIF